MRTPIPPAALSAAFPAALSAALLVLAPAHLAAQDTTAAPSAEAAPVEAPKKKKGLFGKIKDIAKDKTVQSVAKVAACTMVPGGQYVAGAIDAASSASDGNAAGAASGAAGAAAGSSCFGGMPGAAPGGPAGLGTSAAAAGVNLAATAAADAMSSRFGGAEPGAEPGPGTEGGQFVLTEKQEKQMLKQMKKAGLSDEQARQQLELYKQQMSSAAAADED